MDELICAREAGVIARRIAGETILVPTRRRAREMALFTLNEVGSFVWERLDGRADLRALAASVAAHFEVDEAQALADLRAFTRELAAAGCARVAEGTS